MLKSLCAVAMSMLVCFVSTAHGQFFKAVDDGLMTTDSLNMSVDDHYYSAQYYWYAADANGAAWNDVKAKADEMFAHIGIAIDNTYIMDEGLKTGMVQELDGAYFYFDKAKEIVTDAADRNPTLQEIVDLKMHLKQGFEWVRDAAKSSIDADVLHQELLDLVDAHQQ